MDEVDSSAIEVRDGDPQRDLQAVIALNAIVRDLHVAAEPSIFRPTHDLSDIESFHFGFMTEEGRHTFVAEVDGIVVGYVSLAVQRREPHTFAWRQEQLYVHQISVHPECRRRGVGRALMNRVAEFAGDLGLEEVALDTWPFNADARRFFEDLGYAAYNIRLRKNVVGGRQVALAVASRTLQQGHEPEGTDGKVGRLSGLLLITAGEHVEPAGQTRRRHARL